MVKSVTDSLIYYSHHSSITDPGEYAERFSHLPSEIPALCRSVQGIMLHHVFAELYNLELTEERMEEVELRHVTNLLARLLELDDQPLTVPRPPERRLAINCRDFATMLCAMLRHQGVPARARSGFAGYFRGPQSTPGFHVDHWVCEYWKADEQRWVLVDAEVGETEREYCQVDVDTYDVPRDQFLVAGRAW